MYLSIDNSRPRPGAWREDQIIIPEGGGEIHEQPETGGSDGLAGDTWREGARTMAVRWFVEKRVK